MLPSMQLLKGSQQYLCLQMSAAPDVSGSVLVAFLVKVRLGCSFFLLLELTGESGKSKAKFSQDSKES